METTFYQEQEVLVTNARFVTRRETYAMSGITSVSLTREPIIWYGPVLLTVGGLYAGTTSTWMIGLPALVGAVLWALLQPRDWVVSIRTASGEVAALTDRSEKRIQAVISAINQAIIARS